MHQGTDGKEVTFKDVLILMFKKFEKIFVFALAFAIIFAAMGAAKGAKGLSQENQDKLREDYEIKKEEYDTSVQLLSDSMERSRSRLDSITEYTQDSLYYNLDAFHEAVGEIVFYVDTDYQIVPEQYYQNPDKTEQIVGAYCTAYRDEKLYDKLADILGQDVESKYIGELISINRSGSKHLQDSQGNITNYNYVGNDAVVSIVARAEDKETALEMAEVVFEHLNQNINANVEPHETKILSKSSLIISDEDLKRITKDLGKEVTDLQKNLKDMETQMTSLEKSEPKMASVSTRDVVKKAILYGILGGVLGGVIICLWVLLAYLSDNHLDGAYQAQKLYNIEIFANISSNQKKHKPWFAKLIDRMESNEKTRMFADQQKAAEYTDVMLGTLSKGQSMTVAVASTLDTPEILELCQKLEACSGKNQYLPAPVMLKDADSMRKIAQADAVILAEESGVSLIGDINRQIIRLEKTGKEILGMLLID